MYTHDMPTSIRDYVTRKRNCEDIAMSLLVANATGAPPFWVKASHRLKRLRRDLHQLLAAYSSSPKTPPQPPFRPSPVLQDSPPCPDVVQGVEYVVGNLSLDRSAPSNFKYRISLEKQLTLTMLHMLGLCSDCINELLKEFLVKLMAGSITLGIVSARWLNTTTLSDLKVDHTGSQIR